VNRDEKQAVIDRLTDRIRESDTMIVADYRGLTVVQTAEIRNRLRESGASFTVAKNTLARRAAEAAEKPALLDFLQGPTAIAFVDGDVAATAKALTEVARSTRILAVRGAVMEGDVLSADQVRQLGDLPPKDVLLSQIVGAVQGPMQGTVGVLTAPLRDIVALLDAYIAQRQAAEAAA
jgi:large subunit ribosomal protein L10